MFGFIDDFFDFDDDGSLDAMEQGAEFAFLDEITKEELIEKLKYCADREEIQAALEEAGLDPDDYDFDID